MRSEPTAQPRVAHTAFVALRTTPAAARTFLRRTMEEWGLNHDIDTAELIVSELVTNAVKATDRSDSDGCCIDLHGEAVVGVELRADDHVLRIVVQDGCAERPALQVVDEDAENGRGLFLVDALSVRWDVEAKDNGGKVTWAEMDLAVKAEA